ncbi:MAG TPA: tetratricopeptide repeat protein [Bacteroidota bacterium]|nr:tetratricopeptide repeat protein [Bacteroidota bacterium]
MNRLTLLAILAVTVVFFSTTGFQCGSAETTSAKLYMQQKQWDKAEQSLAKAVVKNEKDEEAWYLLGSVRLELKNYMGMNEAYNRALQISDAHKAEISRNRLATWGSMFNEGVRLYNGGMQDSSKYTAALDSFRVAIAMEPDSANTYYVAGLCSYAKKDYDGAISLLSTCLEKDPKSADAARLLGSVHYQIANDYLNAKNESAAQNEFLKAIPPFEKAYELEPDSTVNITNLIDVYDRTKNSDKALALTDGAVTKNPNNKFFRYAYGVFLLKQDKFPQSIEQFSKAIEIDPNYSDARYNLGVAYLNWGVSMRKESTEKAEADQKKAGKGKQVKLDDSYLEKFKLALPYLEKSSEVRPDDAALWQQLGRLYAIINQPDKSKAAFERADKLLKGQ